MLELLAYVVLLLVVMPGLMLGAGKLIIFYNAKLSPSPGMARHTASPPSQNYGTLHQRLVAAAEANPFLPRVFSRSKGLVGKR